MKNPCKGCPSEYVSKDSKECIDCDARVKYNNYIVQGGECVNDDIPTTAPPAGFVDDMKICTKCKNSKHISNFTKNRSTPDGFEYWCRDCRGKLTEKYKQKKANSQPAAPKKAKAASKPKDGHVSSAPILVNPIINIKQPILEEADKTINGARQDQYGAPENSFQIIAEYWSIFIRGLVNHSSAPPAVKEYFKDFHLAPADTANMMVLFKQARKLGQTQSRDNYLDAIGYEAIAADRLIDWEKNEGPYNS